jgi:hypothetical protein
MRDSEPPGFVIFDTYPLSVTMTTDFGLQFIAPIISAPKTSGQLTGDFRMWIFSALQAWLNCVSSGHNTQQVSLCAQARKQII